jgi:hypothetical protein
MVHGSAAAKAPSVGVFLVEAVAENFVIMVNILYMNRAE